LLALFALRPPTTEHHHDFLPAFMTTHYLAEFLTLFCVVYTGSMANISYLCLSWAGDTPDDQPWLRRGLRLTAIGFLFPVGYGIVSLVTIVGTWFGADLYSWGLAAPNITSPGVPICLAGFTIAAWGPRLPLVREWLANRRADLSDYWQLRPLWQTLKPVDPTMVHTPGSLRERFSLEFRLFFRVIEINDWLHQLRTYRDPRVAEILAQRARDTGMTIHDMPAAEEATHILTAVAARAHGRTPGHTDVAGHDDVPCTTSHAFAGERARLVLTARALTCPLVNDVRRSVAPAPPST